MSFLAWMDYSDDERRAALDVIDRFDESEARDELGLGTIRDILADALFPGTSTIQTRVKYFLFIPWIYKWLEKREVPSSELARKARDMETQLIEALLADNDDQGNGVIGRDAREKLKRLASNVYWQGLGRWGIRIFDGSQDSYHRYVDTYYRFLKRRTVTPDEAENVKEGGVQSNWHEGIPPMPKTFPKQASLELSAEEARYLQDRIAATSEGTLLAYLALRAEVFDENVSFAWELPFLGELPENLQSLLVHARNFSEMMHGATLLYNLMIAVKVLNVEREQHFKEELEKWWVLVVRRRDELVAWERDTFWRIVSGFGRNLSRTEWFAEQWMTAVLAVLKRAGSLEEIKESQDLQTLIVKREAKQKQGRARLSNRRALENWRGDSGSAQLAYRWPTARRMLLDIMNGLQRG